MAKSSSVFSSGARIAQLRANLESYEWAARARDAAIEAARPWMQLSDDELWELMFGHTLSRSWMVWSNGHCPACAGDVPMYTWVAEPLKTPWKMRCPHCAELFPKNDFAAFYKSGLDKHGVFDPLLADRSLLFNAGHPDPHDPLHLFGVDDGEGCVDGEKRWRFIGAYLIYGQWKAAIVAGIRTLSAAYVLTQEKAYARKAGILLDRVADLYPTFDFGKQGVMYEGPPLTGYISTWHDACEEVRELALAYDQVFDALARDDELVAFLKRKASDFVVTNPKTCWSEIQFNIEDRIFRDTIENRGKIQSNYPRTEIALLTMKAVLEWPRNSAEIHEIMDAMLAKATAIDGVTGEKGLAGYSAFVIQGLAQCLEQFSWLEPNFLAEAMSRHPGLRQTWRFHIDTWCLQRYYPQIGDTGGFALPEKTYKGVLFQRLYEPASFDGYSPALGYSLNPSMFSFLWRLFELTGDEDYVKVIYCENGSCVDGLPHDLFAVDIDALQQRAAEIMARKGSRIALGSVNKAEWHLAMLRSGAGENERVLWLDYDTGGNHAHADGLNVGFFAKGLDLMPDCGYPPVQYGGWQSPRSNWYQLTAAHNTVVVDGQNQHPAYKGIIAGRLTLWAPGERGSRFRAMRASGPEIARCPRFERTLALIDIDDSDCYVLDIFRVAGGHDHAWFLHSHFGALSTQGLNLEPAPDYGHDTMMKNFEGDRGPAPGWHVDWKAEDHHNLVADDAAIHLRYTGLTTAAEAHVCDGWIAGGYPQFHRDDIFIKRLMVRRQNREEPVVSTFAGIAEPYDGSSKIASIRRLALIDSQDAPATDSHVGIEVVLQDGRRDLLLAVDVEDSQLHLTGERWVTNRATGLRSNASLCHLRLDGEGNVMRASLCQGTHVKHGSYRLALSDDAVCVEISQESGTQEVVAGPDGAIVKQAAG